MGGVADRANVVGIGVSSDSTKAYQCARTAEPHIALATLLVVDFTAQEAYPQASNNQCTPARYVPNVFRYSNDKQRDY